MEQHAQIVQRLDHALDAHDGDMDARRGGSQPAIALVSHQHDRAALGHAEVDAAHAHLGAQEALA